MITNLKKNVMSKSSSSSSSGIGFFGLLGVCFIVLKVLKLITWSWWIVLLPIYGGLTLLILAIILMYIISKK